MRRCLGPNSITQVEPQTKYLPEARPPFAAAAIDIEDNIGGPLKLKGAIIVEVARLQR